MDDMLSAGSGGTIFISSEEMIAYGRTNISATGDNSTNNNNFYKDNNKEHLAVLFSLQMFHHSLLKTR